MYFRQILHPDLGCASYLIADGATAAVVDPRWEIDEYLRAAARAGAEIRHVLETHHHADHVSGRERLLALTGARAHVPGAAGALGDGESIAFGDVQISAMATPGHRPEHVSYLVREGGEASALLAGDSLLVGDVARPDLAVDAGTGARAMWDSLARLLALADDVTVWPAHVAGSLCASHNALTATSSTIGHERATNPLLRHHDPEAFSAALTRCMPARPPRVQRIVELNRSGAAHPGPVPEVDADRIGRLLGDRVCVIDLSDPERFDAGHLDGAINLPPGGGRGTRAAWAAGDDAVLLVGPTIEAAREAAELLRAAGVWNLAAVSVVDPGAWRAAGLGVRVGGAISPGSLIARIAAHAVTLIDVRERAEWGERHVAGSRCLPLAELGDGSALEPLEPPIAVVCASGSRAAIAASILRRRGHGPTWRVSGGVTALADCGAPMTTGPA